jgi:hypothetical protein
MPILYTVELFPTFSCFLSTHSPSYTHRERPDTRDAPRGLWLTGCRFAVYVRHGIAYFVCVNTI